MFLFPEKTTAESSVSTLLHILASRHIHTKKLPCTLTVGRAHSTALLVNLLTSDFSHGTSIIASVNWLVS